MPCIHQYHFSWRNISWKLEENVESSFEDVRWLTNHIEHILILNHCRSVAVAAAQTKVCEKRKLSSNSPSTSRHRPHASTKWIPKFQLFQIFSNENFFSFCLKLSAFLPKIHNMSISFFLCHLTITAMIKTSFASNTMLEYPQKPSTLKLSLLC